MSDRFRPVTMEQLAAWAFAELEEEGSLFGIPRPAFFVPRPDHRFRTRAFGVEIETPFGVAAGPHTQLAQNIVAAWLAGARVIELKTVQTLDDLEIHRPCIDVADEGYNVEWSQELRIDQSFDEYLRAWVLIHALHRQLGFPGDRPGVVFNMSVGYDLAGIRKPNVQWFLDSMADASARLPACVDAVARYCRAVREIEIPARLASSVTLSTMHGCPPGEIEAISRYLLEERGLHTLVKCNPTLLGAETVRRIVNDELGFDDIPIPDAAFGHDLRWDDAVPMFNRLRERAESCGRVFGLKLSNTLEVDNWRGVFDRDQTMYMSGRPLHAVTVNLAAKLAEEFGGQLPLSFAGGADCFNVADLLASGMQTVTVCSDLLRNGGYLRLLQYPEAIDAAFDASGAHDIADFAGRTALAREDTGLADLIGEALPDLDADRRERSLLASLRATPPAERVADRAGAWARAHGLGADAADRLADRVVRSFGRANLGSYASAVRSDWRYRRQSFRMGHTKTSRRLDAFDCIEAPCVDTCPVDQAVPQYMAAVRSGELAEAVRIARLDNPLPSVLGRVCDHPCESTCVRTNLDQPLAIRHIKRFIMEHESDAKVEPAASAARPSAGDTSGGTRVAIVGAGPAGLAAARDLAREGFAVTVFESGPRAGGIPGAVIPVYRLPQPDLDRDLAALERLGVEIRCGLAAGTDFTVDSLRADGYAAVFVAIGAQRTRTLGLPGEDCDGVIDGLEFLRAVREGKQAAIGPRVGVVGGGDSAMDCVRAALRVGGGPVSLIYRRTVDQMPADPEEIEAVVAEGARIVELARPEALHVEEGRLAGLVSVRTEYRGDRDASGRKVPFDVPGSASEIELDTLIVAIGQQADLAMFGRRRPGLTPAGFVAVDPRTMQTDIPRVYAGGDVAGRGPASVVSAAGDGRRAAASIAAALGRPELRPAAPRHPVDMDGLLVRRAHREYRVPIRMVAPERRDFEETTHGYSTAEAAREASRCLDCGDLCSYCVGVCPNVALLTYLAEPVRLELPSLAVADGEVRPGQTVPFIVDQRYQVAVLADFCNECGACVTACPTSGSPWRDKPRLYLDRADFEAEDANAFLLLGASAMEGRFDGSTHRLEIGGGISYRSPALTASLDPATFALLRATPAGHADPSVVSLEPAAVMATLLTGLSRSRPHLTRLAELGYDSR
jgi:NADPH-dependent glutamate synthase beta subunit-like oxidoreductase